MTSRMTTGFAGLRRWSILIGLAVACLCARPALAVTDHIVFSVNGDTTKTSMVQGDEVFWGANCDVGATLSWEIWYDVNNNSVIDTASDVAVTSWQIADGATVSDHGLPDINGTPDGMYLTPSITMGVAAGHYIFKVTNHADNSAVQRVMACTAMSSPPNAVTGTVTIPGRPAPNSLLQNIWIEANADSGTFQIWSALTNANGQFTINVGAAGTGLLFKIEPKPVPGYVTPPSETLTVNGVTSNVVLAYALASDSVWGAIRDDDGALITVPLTVWSQGNGSGHDVQTSSGTYSMPFTASELGPWMIGVNSRDIIPTYMIPENYQFDNSVQHNIQHDFVCPKTDTALYVKITENGNPPTHHYLLGARHESQGYWMESLSDTGANSVTAMAVAKRYGGTYNVQIETFDSAYQIPVGYVLDGAPTSGFGPGDTVGLNLVSGKKCSDTVKVAPGDGPVDWKTVWVNVFADGRSFSGQPDGNGVYTVWADTGTFMLNASCPGWLASPSNVPSIHITKDTVGGLGFLLNKATCRVAGTLQNVTLPLTSSPQIHAHTGSPSAARAGLVPPSYDAWANVDSVTGAYELYLCDGSWVIDPPSIPGYDAPASQNLTVTNGQDSADAPAFAYSGGMVVDPQEQGGLPVAFALSQNYPNPFNPATTISYDLPRAGHVELAIFNVIGRRVATLIDEQRPAGRYQAAWDGRDSQGAPTASGIYFYRLTAGNYTSVRKMILLK